MSICSQSRRYESIRSQRAPVGIKCPHCGDTNELYFSSAQLRRPLYKRMVFAYVRCHSCTHRFRQVKVGSLVFMGMALVLCLFAGVVG